MKISKNRSRQFRLSDGSIVITFIGSNEWLKVIRMKEPPKEVKNQIDEDFEEALILKNLIR